MLTEKQEKKQISMLKSWVEEKELTVEDIDRWNKDYHYVSDNLNKLLKDEPLNLEHIYKYMVNNYGVFSLQTLNEVHNFGFWDLMSNSVSVSAIFENGKITISDYFNGFNNNDDIIPFEDININAVQKFLEEEV